MRVLHETLHEFEFGARGAEAGVLALVLEALQSLAIGPGNILAVAAEYTRFGLNAEASRALVLQKAGHELGFGAAHRQLCGSAQRLELVVGEALEPVILWGLCGLLRLLRLVEAIDMTKRKASVHGGRRRIRAATGSCVIILKFFGKAC